MATNAPNGMNSPAGSDERSSFEQFREGQRTPEIALTILLVLTSRRWRTLLDDKLRGLDQSSARMEAMAAIMASPSSSAQVDVARRLRIEGPTLTRMIDSLERDHLVQRLPDPNDRRTKQLELTPEGEKALEAIFAVSDTYRERLFEGFDRAEMETVSRFLDRLLERLDEGLPDKSTPDA